MQVTKGIWRMREQSVPGSLSSSHARESGNEAKTAFVEANSLGDPSIHSRLATHVLLVEG